MCLLKDSVSYYILKKKILNFSKVAIAKFLKRSNLTKSHGGMAKDSVPYYILDSSKKWTKLTILSTEGAQDSEFRSFLEESKLNLLSKFTDLW